jgi:hypothetical protein
MVCLFIVSLTHMPHHCLSFYKPSHISTEILFINCFPQESRSVIWVWTGTTSRSGLVLDSQVSVLNRVNHVTRVLAQCCSPRIRVWPHRKRAAAAGSDLCPRQKGLRSVLRKTASSPSNRRQADARHISPPSVWRGWCSLTWYSSKVFLPRAQITARPSSPLSVWPDPYHFISLLPVITPCNYFCLQY